jgi:hypothetical protein
MVALEVFAREFDAIDDYLKAVRDILRDGHMPDMAGLDGRVSGLCTMLEQADQSVQQKCMTKLNDLLQKLDICENEIRAFHEAQTKGHS